MTLNSYDSDTDSQESYDDYHESDDWDETGSAWTRKRALLLLLVLVILAALLVFGILPFLDNVLFPRPDLPPLQPPVQV